jgi:paraquat-inducible protein B
VAIESLAQARDTLRAVQALLAPESPLTNQLSMVLAEFNDAAKAVKQLAAYLERNPDSLVRGRAPAE